MDFLINTRLQFEAVGIREVAAEVRRSLAGLASLPAPQRAAAARDIRAGATARIEELTRADIARVNPNSRTAGAQINRIETLRTKMLRDVELMFQQVERGLPARIPGLDKYPQRIQARIRKIFEETDAAFARMAKSPATLASVRAAAAGASAPSAARLAAELGVGADRRSEIGEAADRAEEAARRARIATYTAAMQAGVGTEGSQEEIAVRTAVQERINAVRRQAAVARAEANRQGQQGQALQQAEAELRAATRVLTKRRHDEARAEVVQQIRTGQGSGFQRLQAQFAYRGQNKDVEDYQTLGQFVGSRALTTVGFGIAGSALYGSVRVIGDMIRESAELDRILNQIEAQMESLGDTGTVSMGNVREEILNIAAATGQQADQVASVFFQFRGAFGEGEAGAAAVTAAMEQTDAAMRTVAVTGLSLQEVLDSLVAASNAYGVTIEQLTDRAIGLQERTGAAAREILTFTADLAPVAEQVGLSMEQATAIGAVAIQQSGRSGTALAEAWNRVLPEVQNVSGEILNLYNLPELQGGREIVLQGLATGDIGNVMDQLIRDYARLSDAQQSYILNVLGGRRETQALVPVLENSAQYIRQLGDVDDQGKLDDYFSRLQDTVQLAQARFTEMFKQIGEAIFRSGIADAMVDILQIGGQLASMFAGLMGVVGGLSGAFGGLPVRLALFVGLAKLLAPLMTSAAGAVRAKTAATTAEAASSIASANANNQQAIAYLEVVQQGSRAAVVVRQNAAADTAETGTSAANAAANTRQSIAQRLNARYDRLRGGSNIANMNAYGGMGVLAQSAQMFLNPADARAQLLFPRTNQFLQGAGQRSGILGGLTRTAFGGGSILGRGVTSAGGLAGALSSAAPMLVAFETLNKFFSNVQQQAEEVNALASETSSRLDQAREGTAQNKESYADAQAAIRRQIAEARANQQNTFGTGDQQNFIARGVNFVGGLFGNENAARSAAGQPQDWEVLEEQLAASQSEQHLEVIGSVMEHNAERLAEALQNSTAAVVANDILGANRNIRGADEFAKIFQSEDDLIPAGVGGIKTVDWENLVDPDELTVDNLRAVIDLALTGNQHAADFLGRITEYVENDPALAELLADSGITAEAAAAQGALIARVDDVRKQFEGGLVGSGTYLDVLRAQRESLSELLDDMQEAGNLEGAALIAGQIGAINTEITKTLADVTQQRLNALEVVYDALGGGGSGGDNAAQQAVMAQRIAALTAAIQSPETDIAERFEQIPELLALLRQQWEQKLAAITDPVERAAAEERGFVIPPEIRAVWEAGLAAQDPGINAALDQLSQMTGTSLQALVNNLAAEVIATGNSAQEIVLGWLDREIARLSAIVGGGGGSGWGRRGSWGRRGRGGTPEERAELDRLRELREQTAAAELVPLPATGAAASDSSSGPSAEDIQEARNNVERARAAGDPVREANVAIRQANAAMRAAGKDEAARLNAQAELIDAQNQLQEALNDIQDARYALYEAQAARDPVRKAQIGVERANAAISRAKGEAERLRAEGDLLSAQAELREAMLDLAIAQSEQVETFAEIAGDSVAVAAERVNQALLQLNDVLTDPSAGDAERIRAANAYWRSLGAQRDAQFQDQMGDIDFMLEMEQIGVQQAIRMLEAMMQIPNLTEEQIRNLQQRIKSLRDEAKADYMFNIPTDINLPTLYEVRRLNQTPSGQGYNDNRVVTINFTANNTADAQAIADQIIDGFGGPSRYGNAPRRY